MSNIKNFCVGTRVLTNYGLDEWIHGEILICPKDNINAERCYLIGTFYDKTWRADGSFGRRFAYGFKGVPYTHGRNSFPEAVVLDYDFYCEKHKDKIEALGYTREKIRELLDSPDEETRRFIVEVFNAQVLEENK